MKNGRVLISNFEATGALVRDFNLKFKRFVCWMAKLAIQQRFSSQVLSIL